MPGTLTISTLSDGTNSTSATNCIQGSAKAWVNFNGSASAPTVAASYNVSSITRTGSGYYQANFTNAFANAQYAMVATMRPVSNSIGCVYQDSTQTNTTTYCSVRTASQNGSSSLADDAQSCYIAVFR